MGVSSLAATLAAVSLGLSAGALLAEGGLLVPFWRSITAGEFLSWYKRHAALLMKFFTPVEGGAAIAAIASAALHWGEVLPALAALLAGGLLTMFPIYFQKANLSFAAGTIAEGDVGDELRRWAAWHWGRTLIAITAFVLAVIAM